MSPHWIIIDGYSLLHRLEHPPSRECSETRRGRLIHMLDKVAHAMADRVTVVFDGQGSASEIAQEPSSIEVIYSPAHQTADTVIERLVSSASSPQNILVVSSDRAERQTVEAAGAATMSCGDFLAHYQAVARQIAHTMKRRASEKPGPTLGDFFPKSG